MSLADFLLSFGLWVAVLVGAPLFVAGLVFSFSGVESLTHWATLTGGGLLAGSVAIVIYKFRRSSPD